MNIRHVKVLVYPVMRKQIWWDISNIDCKIPTRIFTVHKRVRLCFWSDWSQSQVMQFHIEQRIDRLEERRDREPAKSSRSFHTRPKMDDNAATE